MKSIVEGWRKWLVVFLISIANAAYMFGQVPPSWTVTPADYSNSITITCDVNELCVDLADPANVVAAFVGGQCRGVASTSILVSTTGNQIATLTVYSNVAVGEQVSFEVYVDNSNTTFLGLDTIPFVADSIYGTLLSPFEITDNHTPSDLLLSTQSIDESAVLGDTVALITAIDADAGANFTFSLPVGMGDNDDYLINGTALTVNIPLSNALDPEDTLYVEVVDDGGCVYSEMFPIHISDIIYPPQADADTITTEEDVAVLIAVLSNDSDADLDIDSSSIQIVQMPSYGNATADSLGSILYTPNASYNGMDTLVYEICDYSAPTPLCDTAIVIITVNPVDDPPIAEADTYMVIESTSTDFSVLLNDSDADNNIDTNSLSIHVFPTNGTATISAQGIITYVPNYFYNGMDTIVYEICDFTSPVSMCDTAIVIITVLPVPTAPTDIVIDTLFINENNDFPIRLSTIQTIDDDPIDSFTYELVAGTGDDDNSQFSTQDSSLYLETKTNFDVKQNYYFRLESTDAFGLAFEKEFVLEVIDLETVEIPLPSTNFISPNGDGKNDFWEVLNVEIYQEFSLMIFDQFGQVIYQVESNYDNTWDAMYKGKELASGNYYYVFKNEVKTYRGNITVVNN